jgi:hypothetical protein
MKGPWWEELIINWGPMTMLVVLWVSYMSRYMRRTKRVQARQDQHMDRVESLLDRIAVGLERRPPSAPSN